MEWVRGAMVAASTAAAIASIPLEIIYCPERHANPRDRPRSPRFDGLRFIETLITAHRAGMRRCWDSLDFSTRVVLASPLLISARRKRGLVSCDLDLFLGLLCRGLVTALHQRTQRRSRDFGAVQTAGASVTRPHPDGQPSKVSAFSNLLPLTSSLIRVPSFRLVLWVSELF
ncbi:hypothetical protein Taro_013293 [Colocasia esculenta]|uniref:Uncharacterized protein n=1 Tax=Colocasia esculenta TaxID=4460 RepID=A0A843UB63_COLES|nr:hypothetical protein [Colocasia esculenta]